MLQWIIYLQNGRKSAKPLQSNMEINMDTKICGRGGCDHNRTPQPVTNFTRSKGRSDGLSNTCKDCARYYYLANHAYRSAQGTKYRNKNKASLSIKKRDYQRTMAGHLTTMYASQRAASKNKRHHPLPSYTKEELAGYSVSAFTRYLESLGLHDKYVKWVSKCYLPEYKPQWIISADSHTLK